MTIPKKLALKYVQLKFGLLSAISAKMAAKKAFRFFCTPQYKNKKQLPPIFAKAEKLLVPFAGVTVQGYRWNVTSQKKLLILHGFESSVINFERYVRPLIEKGYCVLAFDAPAHGRSGGRQLNILVYKDLINLIRDQFGPVTNFIAHSMGALALSMALEEWKEGEKCKAVLIAPATETTTAAGQLFNRLKLGKKVQQRFSEVLKEEAGAPIEWFSIARAAENIKANVLWFHDKDDKLTPLADVAPIIEKKLSNFTFQISEGLGHRRIYRDSKVVQAVLDFF